MKKHKWAYCPGCDKYHFVEIKYREASTESMGREIKFHEKLLYCTKTDTAFMPPYMMDENLWRAHRACEAAEEYYGK